jgi:hypothetical protein
VRAPALALLAALAAAAIGAGGLLAPAAVAHPAGGGRARAPQHAAPAPPASAQAQAGAAPSGPPLDAAGASAPAEEATAEAAQAESDPLVSNGLGSPTCSSAAGGGLSAQSRRNCETSGFLAAPAPTGNYGIDVHIDTGVLGVGAMSVVQDLLITPLWMALVWAVHALLVMLEWAFSIDLLNGSATSGLAGGLRRMQASFTEPWLAIALSCASVLALYHGLIRRRVAETLGEALLMAAMMAAGIWVVTDPSGTVGSLGSWANEASLGTLAVAAGGAPNAPSRALGDGLDTVFAAAVQAPWCYMEFGDVSWCREASRLDPSLRAAALRIAGQQLGEIECQPAAALLSACVAAGSAQAKALTRSAQLLREARSNGAIFLALPANGAARNSINQQGSLLRTLCDSSEASNCRGPTAAQAEFRTGSGTWSRFGGLLLIAGGLLGMLLLLGFVAVRLLVAALASLLLLLLAPAVVVVPAFGEGGRALFRRWATRLLGAVLSKLLFSFLLGALLAMLAILSELRALGWWTQWLLMSAFWWGVFTHRRQLFGVAAAAFGEHSVRHVQRRSIARGVREALETPRGGIAAARMVARRFSKPAPDGLERKRARIGSERVRAGAEEQVLRALEGERREADVRAGAAPEAQHRLAEQRARLQRIERERESALAGGDTRRALRLAHRQQRVREEIEHEQGALSAAQRSVREAEQERRRTGAAYTRERLQEHSRFLDAQAALAPAGRARDGQRRDYAALAGLAGYGRAEYERLDPRPQRAARLEIDRELALRRELGETARTFAGGADQGRLRRSDRRRAGREFDGALERRMQDAGHGLPSSHRKRSPIERWQQQGRSSQAPPAGSQRSSVMRDAHEVAARRKRQLGKGRP